MIKFTFGNVIHLRPLEVRRIERERSSEFHGDYNHRIIDAVMRAHVNDYARFSTIVEVPGLYDSDGDADYIEALKKALERCLERFPAAYHDELSRLFAKRESS